VGIQKTPSVKNATSKKVWSKSQVQTRKAGIVLMQFPEPRFSGTVACFRSISMNCRIEWKAAPFCVR